jgi:hypothetical protein
MGQSIAEKALFYDMIDANSSVKRARTETASTISAQTTKSNQSAVQSWVDSLSIWSKDRIERKIAALFYRYLVNCFLVMYNIFIL